MTTLQKQCGATLLTVQGSYCFPKTVSGWISCTESFSEDLCLLFLMANKEWLEWDVLGPFGCLGTIPILTSYTVFSVGSRAVAQTCCYYGLKGGFRVSSILLEFPL